MKKTIFLCLLALMLIGCGTVSPDINTMLKDKIKEANSLPIGHPNYNHGFYAYYKDPGVGRIQSDLTSNVFMFNGCQFVMNLDVSQIVNGKTEKDSEYFSGYFDENEKIVQESGEFSDSVGRVHPYEISIYKHDKDYYTFLNTDSLRFNSISSELEAVNVASEMYKIARSCVIDIDKIKNQFSEKEVVEFKRKQLELFQNIAPEKGAVDELFDNKVNYAGSNGGRFDGDNYATDDYGGRVEEQEDEKKPQNDSKK